LQYQHSGEYSKAEETYELLLTSTLVTEVIKTLACLISMSTNQQLKEINRQKPSAFKECMVESNFKAPSHEYLCAKNCQKQAPRLSILPKIIQDPPKIMQDLVMIIQDLP